MKKINILSMLLIGVTSFAQTNGNVGINTQSPAATLDVVGQPSVASKLDGIIAPRITGAQLKLKTYGTDQNGTIVFVTDADPSPSGQTNNVNAKGYYYFDAPNNFWAKIGTGVSVTETDPLSWRLLGNSGTTPGTNFIGTTDNKDLVFKRNNIHSGWLNSSILSTGFGVNTLPTTSTGFSNTAFGYNTLRVNSSGRWNTAIGTGVLGNHTTGEGNTGIGNLALRDLVGGNNNTALGYIAMQFNASGNDNTAIGMRAIYSNTTGSENTVVGSSVLSTNNSGSRNTAIGYRAGDTGAANTGSQNIIIGYRADVNDQNANNQLSIGNLIYGNGVDGVTSTISSGNIGVGVKVPTNRLHVSSTANPLRLEGLQAGASSDNALTADATGVVKKQTASNLVPNNTSAGFNTTDTSTAMFVIKRYNIGDSPSSANGGTGFDTGMSVSNWEAVNAGWMTVPTNNSPGFFNSDILGTNKQFGFRLTSSGGTWRIIGDIPSVNENEIMDILFINKKYVAADTRTN